MPALVLLVLFILVAAVPEALAAFNSHSEVDNNPGNLTEDLNSPIMWDGRIGYVERIVSGQTRRYVKFANLYFGLRAMMVNALNLWKEHQYNLSLTQFGEIWDPRVSYGANLGVTLVANVNVPFDFRNNIVAVGIAIVTNERGKAAADSLSPSDLSSAASAALAHVGL